jgi:hypothetical protein
MLAAFALMALLHPSEQVAALACLPVGFMVAYWIVWRRPAAATDMTKAAGPTVLATSFAKTDSPGRMD